MKYRKVAHLLFIFIIFCKQLTGLPDDKPHGLENHKAVKCYFNSTMQCLAITKSLTNSLKAINDDPSLSESINNLYKSQPNASKAEIEKDEKRKTLGKKIINESVLILNEYPLNQKKITELWKNTVCPLFQLSQGVDQATSEGQQDSAEFLKLIFNPIPEKQSEKLSTIFKICSKISHENPSHESLTYDKSGNFELEIPQEDAPDKKYPLANLFENFCKKEGGIEYNCEKCKKSIEDCSKQILIHTLPQTLIIALKRFTFDKKTFESTKLQNPVLFSLSCSIPADCFTKDSPAKNYNYKLVGFTVHSGGFGGGHYWAYVKHNNKWYKCNDSTVTEETNTIIENIATHGLDGNGTPYLFFYERDNLEKPKSDSDDAISLSSDSDGEKSVSDSNDSGIESPVFKNQKTATKRQLPTPPVSTGPQGATPSAKRKLPTPPVSASPQGATPSAKRQLPTTPQKI